MLSPASRPPLVVVAADVRDDHLGGLRLGDLHVEGEQECPPREPSSPPAPAAFESTGFKTRPRSSAAKSPSCVFCFSALYSPSRQTMSKPALLRLFRHHVGNQPGRRDSKGPCTSCRSCRATSSEDSPRPQHRAGAGPSRSGDHDANRKESDNSSIHRLSFSFFRTESRRRKRSLWRRPSTRTAPRMIAPRTTYCV